MKKRIVPEIYVVSRLELDDLYNECFANYLDDLNDPQSRSFEMWKQNYLCYYDFPIPERVVLATLTHFNSRSLLDCSESIDSTFFYSQSKADKLNLETGFIRLLYQTYPLKFLSMMGLLMELLSAHPVISKLLGNCRVEYLETLMRRIAERNFKDCE